MAAIKRDLPSLDRFFSTDMENLHANDSSHGSNLLKGLLTMYKDGRYSDVTLKISQDRRLSVHRVVLASFSPYFEALFGNNWDDGEKKEVEVLGFDENAVSDLIEFAYSGKIDINKDNVQTLLEASNYLQVEFVKQSCGEFLKGAIDDKTCLSIWHLADTFTLEELMKEAKKHFLLHFTEVTRGKEFLSLPVGFLKEILTDEGICVVIESLIPSKEEREKVVLEAVFKYVEHDTSNRTRIIPELLSLVRLPTLSESYLKEISEHQLIADSSRDIISKAQKLQIDPPEKDSRDEMWATTRAFAKPAVSWGRSFANGGQVHPEISHHSNKEAAEDLGNDVFIKGMELWIRRWDGRPVLGGLKIFYSCDGDHEIMMGSSSDQNEHHEFHLESNERIVKVDVNSGWMIDRLSFYTNKKDENGDPKCYGPYGGDGGGFYAETPPGSYGFLAGVGVAVVSSQGEEGITRLQFAWRTYVLPGDPEPKKSRCKVNDGFYDDDGESYEYDEYDDYDEEDDFDEYEDLEHYEDFDDIMNQDGGIEPWLLEPHA